jgi:hypothetical protein
VVEDAGLDVFALAQVDDDEAGGVVAHDGDEGGDVDGGAPSCLQSHHGEHEAADAKHAVEQSHNCGGAGDLPASVEILLFGVPDSVILFSAHF